MCDGRFSCFLTGSHERRIRVERGVVFLGIFLRSEEVERIKVALRESMYVRRDVLGPGISPL